MTLFPNPVGRFTKTSQPYKAYLNAFTRFYLWILKSFDFQESWGILDTFWDWDGGRHFRICESCISLTKDFILKLMSCDRVITLSLAWISPKKNFCENRVYLVTYYLKKKWQQKWRESLVKRPLQSLRLLRGCSAPRRVCFAHPNPKWATSRGYSIVCK